MWNKADISITVISDVLFMKMSNFWLFWTEAAAAAIGRTNCLCKSKWWESSKDTTEIFKPIQRNISGDKKKYSKQSREIFQAIQRYGNIYGNPQERKVFLKICAFHAKSNIWAFESCKIWFLNSINLMLWREKASTIRKGKLFKFCFSADNHLIVEMGTFSHFLDAIQSLRPSVSGQIKL